MWIFIKKKVTGFTGVKNYYTRDNVRLKIAIAVIKVKTRSFQITTEFRATETAAEHL